MLDRKLFRDLGRMKGQVATIAVVVTCGVAVIISSLSTYESLRWSQQHYYETTHFAQIFVHLKRAPAALEQQLRAIPNIAEVETRLVHDVTLDVPGHVTPAIGRMISVPEHGQPRLNQLYLRRGRFLESGREREVIISEGFALANALGPGDRVSAVFNGRRETLEIVGVALSAEYVFALRGGEMLPNDRQFGIFWINYDGLAAAFNMEGAFNDAVLTLAPQSSEQAAIDALDRILEPYGALGAHGRDQQISHRFVSDELKQQEAMATTIPPVFLAVAAFLLNVVLGRVITAQREQIAALKALGYENWAIGWHYLKMVCVIVTIGSVLGVALGVWLGKLMTANYVTFFRFPVLSFRMSPYLPLLAIGVSLLSAVAAALSAVRRVVALAPAEAMRPPTPPMYHRTWIERIGPLQRLSPENTMVLRNIVRQPGRAFLTVVGIAFAVPILVLALFWRDAINYMITVQFSAVERGDVTVTFTEPVTMRAYREIAHLPGVLQVEGMRTVPARLRFGHRSYRTAVVGIPHNAELRRLLDEHLREIPLPSKGLLLTDRLGEKLGLRPGDRVRVETLEGLRIQEDVIVTHLVNDVMGMSAYMDLTALNRLMLEGDVISAVSISFAHPSADEIYARLKQLPKVATVSIKQAAIHSFMETTAKFVLVFTGILTLFAAAIAVGVVYNNARVALAERAWELASLRVLGFTRAEVSAILLSELALELLIAIPIGLWLGYWFVVALAEQNQTELFRIPTIISPQSYAFAALIILMAGVVSALIVRHRVDHLDLVSVLEKRVSMRWRNKGWWLLAGIVVSVLTAALLIPQRVSVEIAPVVRGTFIQTVSEDGKTRVRERYTVSAPLEGVLERIHLKAGDPVEPGMRLAIIHPRTPILLDARTHQELKERLRAVEATRQRTRTAVERAYAALQQARADLERTKTLAKDGLIAPARLEQMELTVTVATKDWTAAKFEDDAAGHQIEMARAALLQAQGATQKDPSSEQQWEIRAPVLGRVLRVWQESEGAVTLGAPLLELADPSELEVVVDVLTTDAVLIRPGAKAWLERWGGDAAVEGRVRLIEPSAFTKISALGVEEQRVNVVIDVVGASEQWKAIGDGYRIDARIEVFSQDEAVKIPTGALFREEERWAVFAVAQGRVRKRVVQVNRQNGVEALVEKGLAPGDYIIVYPSDAVQDGVRVAPR